MCGLVYVLYVREHVHLPLVGSLTAAGQTQFSFSLQGTVSCSHHPTAEVPREFKGTLPLAQTHWPATCAPTCPAQVLRVSSPSLVSPSAKLYPPHLSVPYLGQQPGTGLGMEAKPQLDGCLWPMSCDEGSVPSQALGLCLSFSIGLCSSPLVPQFPHLLSGLVSSGHRPQAHLGPWTTERPGRLHCWLLGGQSQPHGAWKGPV